MQESATNNQTLQAELDAQLAMMKSAHRVDPFPSAAKRIERLKRLEKMMVTAKAELIEAMHADFSFRSTFESELIEITLVIAEIRANRRKVKKWMRPRRYALATHMLPARGRIHPQPKGVVGIISPWNLPVHLAIGPLAGVLAAGNRALIKPSELTPHTSDILKKLIEETFDPSEVAVVTGDVEVATAFSALPFDHLLFTGSTPVGRIVAQAAARNLTPVTLELGGKSPTIIGKSADLKHAAERIAIGKTSNGGQLCVAPDYVLVPRENMDELAKLVEAAWRKMYPDLHKTQDFTALGNDNQRKRIQTLVNEAEAAGVKVVRMGDLSTKESRHEAPAMVINPSPELGVVKEEIFGPVLPIIPYDTTAEAIAYVAERPAPLALYIFADDCKERDLWLTNSRSGGVAVNETNFQSVSMPFGGVGESGMGSYHGKVGFDTFSHLKSVFYQPKLNGVFLFNPPITGFKKSIGTLLSRIV